MDESEQLLAEAARGKQTMLDDARAEAARWIAAATAEGGDEGASQAQHMRDEIAGLEVRMLKEVEGEVVRAAVRVAAEILAAETQAREDAVVDVAATALVAARTARDINLRVNPRDAGALRAAKARLVANLTRARDLEVREDRRVGQGGVLIETESGVIDAQLATQLDELARILGA
ncbi:MAG: flagellar assembly protein FliH [Deltaproteobacteria bacterium]|nr:flagellar assembly protein FliH [Deltaproteobacteria bacterium]